MALRSPLTVQPYDYIADSNGRPLDYGQVYIGVANQDPEFYQTPVYLDAAMTKPIDQPIRTNDGFIDFAGSLSELYASAEVYSVKVLDKEGRKVLYKGDMTRKNLMSDALADLNQSIIDTQTAAQITLNAAVNSANTEVAQTVSLATAAIDTATTKSNKAATDADAAIKVLFENGGLPAKPFATLALMEASTLVDDDYAQVTEDTTNNGLYVKTAGAWVKSEYDPLTQAKSYTDSEKTSAINIAKAEISKIAVFDSVGDNAYLFTDKNDAVLGVLNSNGEFEANDFVTPDGSLTDALKVSSAVQLTKTTLASAVVDESGTILTGFKTNGDVVSPHPPLQGFGIDAIRSQLLDNDSLNSAGAYLDRVASENVEPVYFDVLVAENGADGLGHCRMGSMYQLSETRFYVAYTQFLETGTDQEGGKLCARFVDIDWSNNTSTVGATRIIHDGTLVADEHPPAQPHFFKVKDGVILIANIGDDLVTYKSTDNCMTWTELARFVPSIDFVVGSQKTFWLALDGIVKIPDGIYKDRLVAVGFAWAGIATGSRFFLRSLYSDDMGMTWTKGYHYDPSVDLGLSPTMNETGVTTDTNNDLIMLIRDETGGADSIMTFAKSTDGGKSFKVFSQDTPTSSINCQSGIYQFAPNVWQGVPKIAVTHPSNATSRRGLKLRISYNNCASWVKEYQLYPNDLVTGYTSITKVKKDMLGIVCEYGGFNSLSNVAIKFINLAEIYK